MCSPGDNETSFTGKLIASLTICHNNSSGTSGDANGFTTRKQTSVNGNARNSSSSSGERRAISTGMYKPPSGANPRNTAPRSDVSGASLDVLRYLTRSMSPNSTAHAFSAPCPFANSVVNTPPRRRRPRLPHPVRILQNELEGERLRPPNAKARSRAPSFSRAATESSPKTPHHRRHSLLRPAAYEVRPQPAYNAPAPRNSAAAPPPASDSTAPPFRAVSRHSSAGTLPARAPASDRSDTAR